VAERITSIDVDLARNEYAPVGGLLELREAVADLYNARYRRGMPSQYSVENVAIAAGGRLGLTRLAAALDAIHLGHLLPDYTAYAGLLETFERFIPIPIVLEIICQLCDALYHAHNLNDEKGLSLGIVHRDVSPQNLIVSTSGFVKLIDFGLAKAKLSSVESHSGIIKGKLSYVAPEYLEGTLDVRCDLWAVGVMLHELLTGNRLFDAPDNFAMLDRVRKMAIPPPSRFRAEVTSTLDNIVFKALERDPKRRWQNAASLRAALSQHAREYPPVTKSQLVTWVEWAFAQKLKTREDSGLSALHGILESGATNVADDDDLDDAATVMIRLPATSAAVIERQRESIASMPAMPVGQAMLHRRRPLRVWPWLVGLLAGGVVAVAALLLSGLV